MDTRTIVAAMAAQSVTNGWDAICAVNARRMNSIFLQQYLQDGPTSPATPLRLILQGEGTNFWLLDLIAGPPQVTLPTDLSQQQVQVTMFLVSGALIEIDPRQMVITSAILIDPNESWVTGALSLAKVTGHANTVGQVVVDLGSNAYQPQIKGVDPDSVLATNVGAALQTFFAHNATQYPLGTIMGEHRRRGASTQELRLCDTAGARQQDRRRLPATADPDHRQRRHSRAAHHLSDSERPDGSPDRVNQVIFNRLIPPFLTLECKPMGTTFSGRQANGVWETVSSGGSINIGVLGDTQPDNPCFHQTAFSANSDRNPAAVTVSTTGFTIAPGSDGHLSVQWNNTWSQQWAYWTGAWVRNSCKAYRNPQTSTLMGAFSQASTPSVDPTTDIVTFRGSGTVSLDQKDAPSWWKKLLFGDEDIPSQFTSAIQPALQRIFNSLQMPEIDTFALANLLFPAQHALNLQQAALPCDLLVTGQVRETVAISPATVNLEPGQTQQFTAMLAGQPVTNVLWEIKPALGSISNSGLYTAPVSLAGAHVVVVTAVSESNTNLAGSAMVLLFRPVPPTGLIISPTNLVLTASQSFNLLVTDENGTPVEAKCALSPEVGEIRQGWLTGQWTYTAPSPVTESAPVTVTATSTANPKQTGTGTVTLMVTEKIQITPANQSISVGQSLQLQATPVHPDRYTWQIYPIGVGSIRPNDGNSSQATYAAPSSLENVTEVMVAAYSLGDSAGIGLARVTVNPPN